MPAFKLEIFALTALAVSACGTRSPGPVSEPTLLESSVGPFRVGMTVEEAKAVPGETLRAPDAYGAPAEDLRVISKHATRTHPDGKVDHGIDADVTELVLKVRDGKIAGIVVPGAAYKTPENIWVGIQLAPIEAKYGKPISGERRDDAHTAYGWCGRFERSPGRLICFQESINDKKLMSWDDVRAQDAHVSSIVVMPL